VSRPNLGSPADVVAALDAEDYIADRGVATAVFLAWSMQRPLLLEGEPGVGKTSLARAVARTLGALYRRLQCYGGLDATQALYDWNFPKQILTVRATMDSRDPAGVLQSIYTPEYLIARPIL
jgi:MoxR-like ATPase